VPTPEGDISHLESSSIPLTDSIQAQLPLRQIADLEPSGTSLPQAATRTCPPILGTMFWVCGKEMERIIPLPSDPKQQLVILWPFPAKNSQAILVVDDAHPRINRWNFVVPLEPPATSTILTFLAEAVRVWYPGIKGAVPVRITVPPLEAICASPKQTPSSLTTVTVTTWGGCGYHG